MTGRNGVLAALLLGLLLLGARPVPAYPPPASGADAYRVVEEFASLGVHRTGTAVDGRTARWFAAHLADAGFDVEIQPFDFEMFVPHQASVRVAGLAPQVLPLYYSGTTGPDGVRGQLVDVGLGTPAELAGLDLTGRIVLAHVPMPLPGLVPTLAHVRSAAADAGAVGLVAAIDAPANQVFGVNVDARLGVCGLPVLVVGSGDGALLSSSAGQQAELVLHATVGPGRTQNVVGVLPGTGPGVLVIGTPLNGWFRAATERGTGVGVLLTLARHFAEHPPSSTIVLVGTGGHEVGFLGLDAFVEANPGLVEAATAYVHLGASVAARQDVEVGDRVHTTGLVEPARVLITSENPLLHAVALPAFAGAAPFAAVPPASGQNGEQQVMYEAGVPIVSLSGTFLWFHTPRDLPDTTHPALLQPMVDAFRDVVVALDGLDRAAVRDVNAGAAAVAGVAADGSGAAVERCT